MWQSHHRRPGVLLGRCGWLKDKYGLSWQIIPTALGKLMSDPDPAKSQAVMQAMLKMNNCDRRLAKGARRKDRGVSQVERDVAWTCSASQSLCRYGLQEPRLPALIGSKCGSTWHNSDARPCVVYS